MASTSTVNYTQTVAIGKWADRASLTFVPVNEPVTGPDGKEYRFDMYGYSHRSKKYQNTARRAYKTEEKPDGTTYVCYDDDTDYNVAIYKLVKQEA